MYAGSLTGSQLYYVLLENIITFIFVGIIEVVFFLNVALKFVPSPPSLIFTSIIDNLKKVSKIN
jgi:hypothetical protein